MTVRRRGYTLIESLIAGALFLVLGLFAFLIFKYAMAAHARGLLQTEAQRGTQEIVNRMKADMQSGMLLQIPMDESQDSIQSAVLEPSSEAAQSVDDVMFTLPAVQNLGTLNPALAENYILVRYTVVNHNPNVPDSSTNNRNTAVLRRAYRMDQMVTRNILKYAQEPGVTSTRPAWYYIDKTALDTTYGPPGQDKSVTTANDTGWQEIAVFPGPYDRVTFTVAHAPASNTLHASYDGNHFTITTQVARYLGTPQHPVTTFNDPNDTQNDRIIRDLSSEVTLNRGQ